MERNNPFSKPDRYAGTMERRDLVISAGIHGGIILLFLIAGLFFSSEKTIPMGGGEYVTVEMIVLEQGDAPVEQTEEAVEPVEEVQEEVQEVIEEQVDPVEEQIEVQEEVQEAVDPVEEVQEEVQEETPPTQDFIGVGSQGEAGSGAPGPASYEGRVFSAIRRNFRTSVNPQQSYRIVYTVNLDGTTSYQVVRSSGDNGFDRAVTHAINSANIPPVPPGRTAPVQLSIEFFGPDAE